MELVEVCYLVSIGLVNCDMVNGSHGVYSHTHKSCNSIAQHIY